MKKTKKWLSLLISLSLSATLLAACGGGGETTPPTTTGGGSVSEEATDAPTDSEEPSDSEDETTEEPGETGTDVPLVVGYAAFSGKFSPFFADTAYDQDVASMTQVGLLTTDRSGAIIFNGIEGETHEYGGTPYEYTGLSNLEIDRTDDTTTYTFTIREGVKFSDGVELTADDVIFNLYAYLDPSYVGSNTLQSLPIQGLNEYRTQISDTLTEKYTAMFSDVVAAGRDHTATADDSFTQEQADSVWAEVEELWRASLKHTVDWTYANYGAASADYLGIEPEALEDNEGLQVAYGAYMWGLADATTDEDPIVLTLGDNTYDLSAGEGPTQEDFYDAVYAAFKGDADAYQNAGVSASGSAPVMSTARRSFIDEWAPQDTDSEGTAYTNVAGIVKNDDYSVSVTLDGFDASAVYKLGLTIAPLHYYGDADLYDYENDQFGFEFGNLDILSADDKTAKPMGAGAYVFESYVNKVVEYSANPHFWRGEPKTKIVQFREVNEADKTTGVITGVLDVTDPSFNVDAVDEIIGANSDTGALVGNTVTTVTVDNLGYGYIGINADTVRVGDESASEESKNLRKALATVFSVYRELAVSTYYGERASVINYPISNTSWAAPQETDADYQIAYSVDVEGNPIFTSDMSDEEKYDAALDAAVGFFVAAGYTFDEASGQLTAAPEGASLDYEIIVPAGGQGDHPAFQVLSETADKLAEVGFELIINDPADSNELWNKLDAGTQEMWTAAWGATIDPDMYQVYHSSNIVGEPNSSESNHYHVRDPELDALIMEARLSDDQEFRKITYKAALEIILDWGVEIPTYQRLNAVIFSSERVNMDTVTPDITTFWGWMNDIELLEMNPDA